MTQFTFFTDTKSTNQTCAKTAKPSSRPRSRRVSERRDSRMPYAGRTQTSFVVTFRSSNACKYCVLITSSAYVSLRQSTSAYVSLRQPTSAYVSLRQHMSASVSNAWKYWALMSSSVSFARSTRAAALPVEVRGLQLHATGI